MSKILLISANFENVSLATASDHKPKGIITEEASHYPLGLAYLISYLEQKGHKAKALFLNNYSQDACTDKVIDSIEKFLPDIIGFQIFTSNRISTYKLIKHIHEHYPEIKLVIGGIHTTIMHKQLLRKFPYLVAVLGEGEITFSELIDEFKKEKSNLDNVRGISYSRAKKVVTTPPRELIASLDELPFPKHEEFFKNINRTSGCILTSRGCAFACSFCCLESVSRRNVRMRSAKNVVDEIEALTKKQPQIKKIWIQDDNFFLDNNRVIEICNEIINREIKASFICSARLKPLNEKMVKALERANFQAVLFGLESGDREILKRCHKRITPEDAINAIKLFSKTKIRVNAFLIVGLPGETRKTILNTAKLIQDMQKIKYFPLIESAVLTIYPGTEIYEIAKGEGQIDDNFWLSDKPVPLYVAEHNKKELLRFKRILLNHISILNFLTPGGFISQFRMIPKIIKYVNKDRSVLYSMISRTTQLYLPNSIHKHIKNIYQSIKNN